VEITLLRCQPFLGLNRHIGIPLPANGFLVLVVIVVLPSLGNVWFIVDLLRGGFSQTPPK
jgi:hypothetical protein